jgi:predicted amidohydrolase
MSDLAVAVAQSFAEPGRLRENVGRHVRLASQAADHGARFVLFPELSLVGYGRGLTTADALVTSDARLQPLRNLARARAIAVVAGAPPAGLHIASIVFAPDGGVGTYVKQHVPDVEAATFVPGRGGTPLAVGDEVVGLAICADITQPQLARASVKQGATIYAASCLISDNGYEADAACLRRAAVDHQILVLMANYAGPVGGWPSAGKSAIWSPAGERLAAAPAAGEALVVAERSRGRWTGRVVECAA